MPVLHHLQGPCLQWADGRGEAKEFEFVKAPPVAEDQQVGEPLLCSHPLLFLVRKAELGKVILGEHKLPVSPLKSPAE